MTWSAAHRDAEGIPAGLPASRIHSGDHSRNGSRGEMTADSPIREADLHAYLDGELPRKRAADVEAYLRDHPCHARRLARYRADKEAIARLFSRVPRTGSR